MLFGILLTAQVLICAVMGGLILIQQSEGGALGMGGGPSGFMSARGAGNLLTKLTWVFAALLFANSIGMTVVGNLDARSTSVVDQVDTSKLTSAPLTPATAGAAAAAASSTSSAPSLNDLPIASTPNASQAPATNNLSTLPSSSPILAPAPASSAAASPVAAPKMPKPLAATPAAAPAHAHLPAALGTTSVSTSALGSKASHSAAATNIFQTSSSSAKPAVVTPSSSASTTPSSAPATSPSSSQ